MIPTIEEIIDGLLCGVTRKDQALAWLKEHDELSRKTVSYVCEKEIQMLREQLSKRI